MPALTKITFEVDTVKELATKYGVTGRIVGIKDSSFDLNYISQLCQIKKKICPSWSILTGAEWHVAQVIRMGGDGGVVGGGRIYFQRHLCHSIREPWQAMKLWRMVLCKRYRH